MTPDTTLGLASTLGEATLLVLLAHRRVYKVLPLFSSYILFMMLVDAVQFLVAQYRPTLYPRVYLGAAILDAAFMFCVLIELSMSVLKPIRASLPRRSLLVVAGLLGLLFAVIWPFAKPPGLNQEALISNQYIFHLSVALSALRILFFLALAGFSQLLSIGWRDRELQIATGFGFFSLFSLSVTLLHMNQGMGSAVQNHRYHVLDEMVVGSYICSMVYWIISFAQKVPERREFTPQMQNFLLAMAGSARATRIALASTDTASGGKTNP